MRIAQLRDLTEDDRREFGGKTVSLALLARRGLPVPDGFALAFEDGAPARLGPDEREALRETYARFAEQSGGDAPPRVAVRSSAVGEDGAELSFAGQHATQLDVVGEAALSAAVEVCLASQHAERAVAYRKAAGARAGGMGVLVQHMVAAEFAGICFTRSPHAKDELAVEVVEGLGEALAAGTRTPARFAFAREGLEPRGEENADGVIERFGRERVREVARLSLAAEAGFGFAVDVEWAYAAGSVQLVQARPITALATRVDVEAIRREEIERLRQIAGPRVVVWSDFGVADVIGRPSPLGCEIIKLLTKRGSAVDRSLRALGLRYAPSDRASGFFESICGRAYLNLAELVESVDGALPVRVNASALPDTEGRAFDPEQIPVRLAWRGWRSALRLPGFVLRLLFVVPVRFIRLRRRFDREWRESVGPAARAEAARLRKRDLAALDGAELWADFRSHVQRFTEQLYHHQLTDNIAFPTHGLLRRHLRMLYGDDAVAVEMRLTTALPGNFNTETNLDLARVAKGELALEEFLERYGHRGSPDFEISAPRWREEPERVEAMAKAIARSGVDPVAQFEQQKQLRADAEVKLSTDIKRRRWLRPWHRGIMRNLGYYQRYSPLREPTQAAGWLFLELARRALLEAARRSGVGDLIFYFAMDELEALFTRGADPEQVERARGRRARWRAAQGIYVPHVVRSDDLEAIGRVPSVDSGARELSGQPVSGGVARGRARVVHGLEEAREIEAGEIVVAASADPTWTPLFLIAGGLVLEQGGMLSHPAIVAREYGLPALVNVAHATKRVRTGQMLTLDADAGRVVLES